MFHQLARGILARTLLVADSSGDYRIELWDLLVGPGQRSDAMALPGGAVLEVRAGSGRIELDRAARELRPGTTLAVREGSKVALTNTRQDLGLSIRAVVVRRRAR